MDVGLWTNSRLWTLDVGLWTEVNGAPDLGRILALDRPATADRRAHQRHPRRADPEGFWKARHLGHRVHASHHRVRVVRPSVHPAPRLAARAATLARPLL